MKFIARTALEAHLRRTVASSPVTVLLGPRQCGKTTLAQKMARHLKATYFDLEDPEIQLTPETASVRLRELRGLIVIDECQRLPSLFSLLRVLADRRPLPARFLLLGSASMELIRGASESLAGRLAYIEMGGLSLPEIGSKRLNQLWRRGTFPDSFLSRTDALSFRWRMNFIQSFLERDLPLLGIRIPSPALRRFWTMLAHLHGQHWNASELARSMSVQEPTARRYLDILSGSYMVRQLMPWFENTGKRLIKAPKIYLRDSGILHALLGLRTSDEIESHPKLGFSWEGFALEEIIRITSADRDAYFYGTHGGAELDLLLMRGGKRYGFEFKFADAPSATKSMHGVMADLQLEQLWVIYPGERQYPLAPRIQTLPLKDAPKVLNRLKI
jgi:predicted AAA+ superfamily ATPase